MDDWDDEEYTFIEGPLPKCPHEIVKFSRSIPCCGENYECRDWLYGERCDTCKVYMEDF